MKFAKCIERFGKRGIRKILKRCLKPIPVKPEEFDHDSIGRILVVRQDSRLGNLVLMTPLIRGLKEVFPAARIDVLISEGFEEVLEHNPDIDRTVVFRKKKARLLPWSYPLFINNLRKERYDLVVDASNGYHFSLNNVLLVSFSGARYRLGYARGGKESYFNLPVPLPSEETHMADAMLGLVKSISPDIRDFPLSYYLSDSDRAFAQGWLKERRIMEFDSFFVIHPGGRGEKQWGPLNFAELIDRINSEITLRIVVIGSKEEYELIEHINDLSESAFDIVQDVTIGQMAAIIERCDMFISNDTGPMHVSIALGRPTVGIFISSDFRVYGPRGRNGRIIINTEGLPTVDDVMVAVMDLLDSHADMETEKQ